METDAEANMGLTGAAAVAERSAKALGVEAGGLITPAVGELARVP